MKIELTGHEKKLVDAGQNIQAIKEIRQRLECGLIQARDAAKNYMYSNPAIAKDIRERFRQVRDGLEQIEKNDDLPAMRTVNRKFEGFFVDRG